ncbi:Aminoglycoside phosphotransferase [Penicillium malachiteum]|uniref:Aminoglycoside phosphotransferase n=1 Tax=Penicillium malachiteum TaxID=1324776 RepID=UPI002546BA25|nr:Aminoglycoside phosphotransferase [Penicillium malachiteum]KAJ5731684.1 Aminoglycoside phosphotransferase [Penicillium malachiteum]
MSRGHILHDCPSLEELPRGPFKTESEFYDSLLTAMKYHAESLPMTPHCFIAPVPSREYHESDAALNLITRRESLNPELLSSNSFPLYHPDLSANNIFVDDDFNIKSIIDRPFCSSVPLSVLLSPPGLPQSRYKLPEELHRAFKEGYKDACRADSPKGHHSLASDAVAILEDTEFTWSLIRLLTFDSLHDFRLFRTLWDEVHRHDDDIENSSIEQRLRPHYMQLYEEIQADDRPISEVRKREKDDFSNATDFAVARYLTVVSNWGSIGFQIRSCSWQIENCGNGLQKLNRSGISKVINFQG